MSQSHVSQGLRRPLALLVALMLAVVGALVEATVNAPPASAASGAWSSGSFERVAGPGLPYWLYAPPAATAGPALPLVVYLQGCNQTPHDAALGTRWNAVAEQEGFLVVYPEQQTGLYPAEPGNVSRCWNFASPLEWSRTGGEAEAIAAVTRQVMATWSVDASRVYVAGVSAGGAMASAMAALYPDLYAAAGILLGCSFPCGDATGSGAYQAMGSHARRMPVFVAVGAADPVINPAVGEVTVMQWLGTNDLVDDQLLNGSVSQVPASVTQHGWGLPQGGGDSCIDPSGPQKLPCPFGAVGYRSSPYTVRSYADASGELIQYWIVYGLSHAYPGGDPAASFTDPSGPAVTEAVWQFFAGHAR